MIKLNSIAFFWVGGDTIVPKLLVDSIKLVMGQSVEIVQLTDTKTPKVNGVTSIQRFDLSKHIMVARLQAYSNYRGTTDVTFFCDADSLFIKPLKLNFGAYDVLLSKRKVDILLNDMFPEFYPEFTGKTAKEVMPFLFGAIATRGDQSKFFSSLLDICLRLPIRFHRWYGDQYALASMLKSVPINYGTLDISKHLYIVKAQMTTPQLLQLRKEDVQMVTFKGPTSKKYIAGSLLELEKL